jgi:anti-sigma B factor antagonist
MTHRHHHLEIQASEDGDGRLVLALSGDVDLKTAPRLRDRIDAAANAAATIVIDLREVRFMDSPGLGMLIYCHQRLADRDTELVVRGARGHVRDLFEVVRLDALVPIEPEA